MVRDNEIKRLINYANGLGCKVTIYNRPNKSYIAACIVAHDAPELSEIKIYYGHRMSKTNLVLTLVHELAHLKSYIKNDYKLLNSDVTISKYKEDKMPRWARKRIFEYEREDMKLWDEIIADCNIRINPKRIAMQKALDLLPYCYYYLKGKYPKGTEKTHLVNEIKQLFKGV